MILTRVLITQGVTALPLKENLIPRLKGVHKSNWGWDGYLDGRRLG
jgi:hypothetical protein